MQIWAYLNYRDSDITLLRLWFTSVIYNIYHTFDTIAQPYSWCNMTLIILLFYLKSWVWQWKSPFMDGLLNSTQVHTYTQKSCSISPLILLLNTVQGITHAKPPTVVMCTIYFATLLHIWAYQWHISHFKQLHQLLELDQSHFLLIFSIPLVSVKFFAVETLKLRLNDRRNLTVISVMIVLNYHNNCTI